MILHRSLVIDHIKDQDPDQNFTVAHFYYTYQDRETQTAELVLASILRQIIESEPELPKLILELHRRLESQQRQLQQEDLEQTLAAICANLEQAFIVIDALDEGENKHRRNLVRSIANLRILPSVKILLTSRPHVEYEVLKVSRSPLEIEIGATDNDLRTYLSRQIEDSDNLDVIDEKFREEIIMKVIQAAHRMYVHTISRDGSGSWAR